MKISSEVKRFLQDQVIDERGPGTLRLDFEALLEFFRAQTVVTSGKRGDLPVKLLPELNRCMSRATEGVSPRARQSGYPYVQALYLLLRATGFVRMLKVGSKFHLELIAEVHASWQALNPTEQYFTLIETWWLRARPETIGTGRRMGGPMFTDCMQLLRDLQREPLLVDPGRPGAALGAAYGARYNLPLLILSGLVVLIPEHHPEQPQTVCATVHLSPFGSAVLALLDDPDVFLQAMFFSREDPDDSSPENPLRVLLQPFFPQWETDLASPVSPRREGRFIFKVSLGRVWRKLSITSSRTLDTLAAAILAAFGFDNDHLYRFEYTDPFGAPVWAEHPYCTEETAADEVGIGTLPLPLGTAMTFLFDFGDAWKFTVVLERIDPPDQENQENQILEAHGTPPSQYGDEGEWD